VDQGVERLSSRSVIAKIFIAAFLGLAIVTTKPEPAAHAATAQHA